VPEHCASAAAALADVVVDGVPSSATGHHIPDHAIIPPKSLLGQRQLHPLTHNEQHEPRKRDSSLPGPGSLREFVHNNPILSRTRARSCVTGDREPYR
jgi:hypothetical protein